MSNNKGNILFSELKHSIRNNKTKKYFLCPHDKGVYRFQKFVLHLLPVYLYHLFTVRTHHDIDKTTKGSTDQMRAGTRAVRNPVILSKSVT